MITFPSRFLLLARLVSKEEMGEKTVQNYLLYIALQTKNIVVITALHSCRYYNPGTQLLNVISTVSEFIVTVTLQYYSRTMGSCS